LRGGFLLDFVAMRFTVEFRHLADSGTERGPALPLLCGECIEDRSEIA